MTTAPKTNPKRSIKRRVLFSLVTFTPLMTFGGFAWALPTYDHLSYSSYSDSSLRMSGRYSDLHCNSLSTGQRCGMYARGTQLDAPLYAPSPTTNSRSLRLERFNSQPVKKRSDAWTNAEKYYNNGDVVISIIIDDLGWSGKYGRKTTELPGPVACAVLPHTRHARELAERAHRNNKEVMLHQPFQPMNRKQEALMGKGGITNRMSRQQTVNTLLKNLSSVPHVTGINNHMGSRLTRDGKRMAWVMEALHRSNHTLFYVDSLTTPGSQGLNQAHANAVPTTKRDIFLDHRRSVAAVRRQFQRLIRHAKRNGSAVAIGHPYPETVRVLQEELKRLHVHNVRLVPVREMIVYRQLVAAAKKQPPLAYSKY